MFLSLKTNKIDALIYLFDLLVHVHAHAFLQLHDLQWENNGRIENLYSPDKVHPVANNENTNIKLPNLTINNTAI